MPRFCLLLFFTIASAGIRADHRSLQAGAEATEEAVANRLEGAEFAEITALLKISEGSVVADVGAGGGAWTFRLAARVGTTGRVFATEVRRSHVDDIAERARRTGRANVTAIFGSQQNVGLPADCCDAMLLRLVYHAFVDPASMREGIRRAVRPGGLVLAIDFRPTADDLTAEMARAGFERVQFIERWRGQTGVYALLFQRLP